MSKSLPSRKYLYEYEQNFIIKKNPNGRPFSNFVINPAASLCILKKKKNQKKLNTRFIFGTVCHGWNEQLNQWMQVCSSRCEKIRVGPADTLPAE